MTSYTVEALTAEGWKPCCKFTALMPAIAHAYESVYEAPSWARARITCDTAPHVIEVPNPFTA